MECHKLALKVHRSLHVLHQKQAALYTWRRWLPALLCAVSFLLLVAASVGLMKLKIETDPVKLWLPSSDDVLAEAEAYQHTFGTTRVEQFILIAPASSHLQPGHSFLSSSSSSSDLQCDSSSSSSSSGEVTNVLTDDFFNSLFKLHTRITTQLSVTLYNKTYFFNDLCLNVTAFNKTGCYQYNPLAYWGTAPGQFQQPSNVLSTINNGSQLVYNVWTKQDTIIGGITTITPFMDDSFLIEKQQQKDVKLRSNQITGAKALQVSYFLDESKKSEELDPHWSEALDAFEKVLLAELKSSRWSFATIYPNMKQSFETELTKSAKGDWPVLACAIVAQLLLFFLSSAIFVGSDFFYRSKIALGVVACLAIVLPISSSFGIASLIGIAHSPIANFVMFLLCALAMYHLFLIFNSYEHAIIKYDREYDPFVNGADHQPDDKEPLKYENNFNDDDDIVYKQFVATIFCHAMPSITISSFCGMLIMGMSLLAEPMFQTNMIAGLESFTLIALIGMAMEVFTLNFFFLSFLSIDALRVSKQRMDCLPCLQLKHTPSTKPGVISFATRHTLVPTIQVFPIKVFAVAICVGLVSFSVYTIAMTRLEARNEYKQDSLPQSDYLYHYYNLYDKYFNQAGDPIFIAFGNSDVDYKADTTPSLIDAILAGVVNSTFVEEGSVLDWYHSYLAFLTKQGLTAAQFYAVGPGGVRYIDAWLQSAAGAPFALHVIFDGSLNNTVKASQLSMRQTAYPSNHLNEHIKAMEGIRHAARDASKEAHKVLGSYAFSSSYTFYQQYSVLARATLWKCILGGVAGVVIMVIVLDPLSVFLMAFSVLVAAAGIMGITMHYLNINFSPEAAAALLMAPVFSLEFNMHLAHHFMRTKGRRSKKLGHVLKKVGVCIVSAMFCLVTGALVVIIFAEAPINYSFAILFVSILGLVSFHSLFFVPSLLSCFGIRITPRYYDPYYASQSDGEEGEPTLFFDDSPSTTARSNNNSFSSVSSPSFSSAASSGVYRYKAIGVTEGPIYLGKDRFEEDDGEEERVVRFVVHSEAEEGQKDEYEEYEAGEEEEVERQGEE
ncbi:NPC intracellular cholesterol transporter 1 [Balamuthia mandrillaris]